MTVIFYRDRLAALAEGDLILDRHIAVLERDHPKRRFVSMLGIYALEIQQGTMPGPYLDFEAQHFARAQLMPADIAWPLLGLDDAELAERFNLPLEQIPLRRQDLLLQAAGA